MTLLAASRLRVGARRLRALARGDAEGVRSYIAGDSATRLAEARRDARADGVTLDDLDARIVAIGDPAYPAALLDLRDPPAFLSIRGSLPRGGIAVIGSREASARACAFATELVTTLGRPLVSGLARGVDAAAHRAAVDARLPQVAYVATGLAHTYPPEHADLADAILAAGGALASERLPAETISRWALIRRDRLQAAHAQAVVLIESEIDGGAMHTMAFAKQCGRPRFAMDGDASGNRRAIADGASPLAWNCAGAAASITAHLSA